MANRNRNLSATQQDDDDSLQTDAWGNEDTTRRSYVGRKERHILEFIEAQEAQQELSDDVLKRNVAVRKLG